jgi:Tfp pilus assembly protein PilO
MNVSGREKRLLLALAAMVVLWIVFQFVPEEDAAPAVVPVAGAGAPAGSVEAAQKKLSLARTQAARLPGLEEELKKHEAALASLEKRLLTGDTGPQASANLTNAVRRLVRAQGDGVNLRNTDLGSIRPAGEYAEVAININVDCRIEGLLNLLADLTAQPELIAWRDLRIVSADQKTKRLNAQFTVAARGSKKLLPPASARPGGLP